MAKVTKSQWDFGDLFQQQQQQPPQPARQVLTVSEVTLAVRRLLEAEIGRVWVTGEITNLRVQSSGHVYFSIKDAAAQLFCVLFRTEARQVSRDILQDGKKVVLQGDLTVYEARGQYQLRVTQVELQGIGALQAAFERLKQKLQAEGLFAAERKRPLPRYAQHIGIATSGTGAALRDVLHVIGRRNPSLRITLANCRVQGQGAAEEIACAIAMLNEWSQRQEDPAQRLDLILITRGGGSLEDLWAFNEEAVARAIFNSALPVVSAVGHEIDFTISDFVADFRAATPSAAAELITEGIFSSREFVFETVERLSLFARDRCAQEKANLERASVRLARRHPRHWMEEQSQLIDDLQERLMRCARGGWRRHGLLWGAVRQRLARLRPALVLQQRRERFGAAKAKLRDSIQAQRQEAEGRLKLAEGKLGLLSPMNVLDRGYSITLEARTGKVIRAAGEVKNGDLLRTRVHQGEIRSRVEGDGEGGK